MPKQILNGRGVFLKAIYEDTRGCFGNFSVISGGFAALLFDGLDLLDPFEVTSDFLLQNHLKDLVRQRLRSAAEPPQLS